MWGSKSNWSIWDLPLFSFISLMLTIHIQLFVWWWLFTHTVVNLPSMFSVIKIRQKTRGLLIDLAWHERCSICFGARAPTGDRFSPTTWQNTNARVPAGCLNTGARIRIRHRQGQERYKKRESHNTLKSLEKISGLEAIEFVWRAL